MEVIADDEILYRRVQAGRGLYKVLPDGRVQFSSQAFLDPRKRPSVDRAILQNYEAQRSKIDRSDGVTSIVAHEVRAIKDLVRYDEKGKVIVHIFAVDVEPVPLLDNQAHAEIVMHPAFAVNDGAFKKLRERLAILANQRQWAAPPE